MSEDNAAQAQQRTWDRGHAGQTHYCTMQCTDSCSLGLHKMPCVPQTSLGSDWRVLQILGERARARVPADFITQSLDAANPPTLFLVLADMARGLHSADKNTAAADLQFLQAGKLLHAPCAVGLPCRSQACMKVDVDVGRQALACPMQWL